MALPQSNATLALGHAPWREDAYDVAIDTRVDTRYKQRDKYYETTARTIAALIDQSPGVPVAVFFRLLSLRRKHQSLPRRAQSSGHAFKCNRAAST